MIVSVKTHALLLPLVCCAVGCITPRSAGLGITAVPVPVGAAEAGISAGVAIGQSTLNATSLNRTFNSTVDNTISAPSLEANFATGLTDLLGLNVHASAAGLQPGLKVTLLENTDVTLSVLPAVGFGFYSSTETLTLSSGTTTTPTTSVSILGGLKVLGWHSSGFYGGIGYDFQFASQRSTATSFSGSTVNTVTLTSHILNLGIGYEFVAGPLRIRPEIAVLFAPGVNQEQNSVTNTSPAIISTASGNAFTIFPNVTVAAATHAAAANRSK